MKKIIKNCIIGAVIIAVCLSLERLNLFFMIKTGHEIPVITDILHNEGLRISAIAVIVLCFALCVFRDLKKAKA